MPASSARPATSGTVTCSTPGRHDDDLHGRALRRGSPAGGIGADDEARVDGRARFVAGAATSKPCVARACAPRRRSDVSSTSGTVDLPAPALTVSVTVAALVGLASAARVLADDDVDRDRRRWSTRSASTSKPWLFERAVGVGDRLVDDVGDGAPGAAAAGQRRERDDRSRRARRAPSTTSGDDQRRGCGRRLLGGGPRRRRRADGGLLHRRGGGDGRTAGAAAARRRDLGDERGDGRGRERTAAPEAQEVGAHVVGGLVAVVGILRERGEDDLLEVGRERRGCAATAASASSRTCLYATATGESPVNGTTPVTIS